MMTRLISVAILEDHQSIIDGYLYRLSFYPEITFIGSITYGCDLLPFLSVNKIDVLILDISVHTSRDNPNPFPILHTIPQIFLKFPTMGILVISMHNQLGIIKAVLESGVHGYVIKDDRSTVAMLGEIIQNISKGAMYISKQVQEILSLESYPQTRLSSRQLEVLSLCASEPGASLNQIAEMIGIAPSSIRNLMSKTYQNLNVSSRTTAVAKARQMGLITPIDPGAEHS